MLAVLWAIFMRSLIHYFFTVRSCGCWFFRIYFGILQILYGQSLLSYEILGILESDFYHWILGILDLDVSFHCGIQEILDPERLVCRWILGILHLEFLFQRGILEILDLD